MGGPCEPGYVAARGLGVQEPVAGGTTQQALCVANRGGCGLGVAPVDGFVGCAYRAAESAALVAVAGPATQGLARSFYRRLVIRHFGLP